MKKLFTFAAMVAITMSASAQTESAFLDAEALLGADAATTAVNVAAETVFCSTTNVTMKAAWADTYKIVNLTAETDAANKVVIDGVTYDMPTGIQGQNNPKPSDLVSGGQNSGAVFKFDVKADGVLYVFGKLTGNKSYYVWEGDVANAQGLPVAYTMKAQPVGGGDPVGYTLKGDVEGYYVIGNGYDNGTALASASWCVDVYKGLTWGADINPTKTWGSTWTGGNALGVIAFPVYKDAATYFVNACGSKITCNGFAFVPGATAIGNISFAGASTGINGITVDGADNANAPVYNLAGQRVSKDAKGILIQNGKKFIK
ncbi:MAG: hypothetical protein MR645_01460 [Paraprevotella sp.]|nr:hypothetical protein [Paraprevotella sp.]